MALISTSLVCCLRYASTGHVDLTFPLAERVAMDMGGRICLAMGDGASSDSTRPSDALTLSKGLVDSIVQNVEAVVTREPASENTDSTRRVSNTGMSLFHAHATHSPNSTSRDKY